MTTEELTSFFNRQIDTWALAKRNYAALREVRRKPFRIGDLEGFVEYNPARAVSSLAKVDKDSIQRRKCFLCGTNRPGEQMSRPMLNGEFELLVNPYPIVDHHFTIASVNHERQQFSVDEGYKLAMELPEMVVFFNHAGAGASAPDHKHFQGVPLESLPLIKRLEEGGEGELPFQIYREPKDFDRTEYPINAFFWQSTGGEVKSVVIRRRVHRPACYFAEPPKRRAVSPGAIDMTGRIIIPCEEDFEAITNNEIEAIYKEVAY